MEKLTLSSISSVSNLITALLAQLVIKGWSQVGSTGIYKTPADSDGRIFYIEPFEDTVSNLMLTVAPRLNDAGTAMTPVYASGGFSAQKGCNFSSGDWTLYCSSKTFFLVKGTTNNSQRVWCGLYTPLSGTSSTVMPFVGFLAGCRRLNSSTAYIPHLIGRFSDDFLVCTLFRYIWSGAHITFMTATYTTPSTTTWRTTGFADGKECCAVPLICSRRASEDHTEREGICGIIPDLLCVSRNPDLSPGDTVTLPTGEKYEFREHTTYWDEYQTYFLLWRIN